MLPLRLKKGIVEVQVSTLEVPRHVPANVGFESKTDMCAAKSYVRFTPDIPTTTAGPLGARTIIYRRAHPLSKVTDFFAICARCNFQHLIGNFIEKRSFVILFDGHFIHRRKRPSRE